MYNVFYGNGFRPLTGNGIFNYRENLRKSGNYNKFEFPSPHGERDF